MVKYHISPKTGAAVPCHATAKPCPVGDAADHYPTKEAAQKAYEEKNSALPTPQAKGKFGKMSVEERAEYFADEAHEDEAFELINKIYDDENKLFEEDLEALGNKVSADYRDNHRGSYAVRGFKVEHEGETLYGVVYDDGDDGGTGDFFENQMSFANSEQETEDLLAQEIRDFIERIQ